MKTCRRKKAFFRNSPTVVGAAVALALTIATTCLILAFGLDNAYRQELARLFSSRLVGIAEASSGGGTTQYTLTVYRKGQGWVNVQPPNVTISPTWSNTYGANTTVTLTAIQQPGYAFDHWEYDVSGTSPTVSVVMTGNKRALAVFKTTDEYTLSLEKTGEGHVTVTELSDYPSGPWVTYTVKPPWSQVYLAGSTITLDAVPAEGYSFTRWEVNLTGTTRPQSITMNSDKTVRAVFTKDPATVRRILHLTKTGEGQVRVEPPQEVTTPPKDFEYDDGETVHLRALPADGYSFTGWSGDISGTSAEASLQMVTDKSVQANFAPVSTTFTLEVTANRGNCSLKATPPASTVTLPWSATYPSSTSVTLEALAPSGYVFSHWEGDLSGTENPKAIMVNSNKKVQAQFVQMQLEYGVVEVRYNTFISSSVLWTGWGSAGFWAPVNDYYGGDTRGFNYGGSYRTRQTARITRDPSVPNGMLGSPSQGFGITKGYDSALDTHLHACNDLFRYLRFGFPSCTERAVSGQGGNSLSMTSANQGAETLVSIAGQGIVQCNYVPVAVSPDIDIGVEVIIKQDILPDGSLGAMKYKLSGFHDKFPWHELYLNGFCVYKYAPCQQNVGPDILFGNNILYVSTDWKTVPGQ